MSNKGWIKLHRKLLDNEKWCLLTPNQKVVYITILLKANPEAKAWSYKNQIYTAKEGDFITSLNSLAKYTGLKKEGVRKALKKLENIELIKIKTTKYRTLITILNWSEYQQNERTQFRTQEECRIMDFIKAKKSMG